MVKLTVPAFVQAPVKLSEALSTRIWPSASLVQEPARVTAPPVMAWMVPWLIQLVPVTVIGGRFPELSPLIVPRLSRLAVPELMMASKPACTVMPAAMVKVLPVPESVNPLPPLMVTVPVPPNVWVPAKARVSALPFMTTPPPASVNPAPATSTIETAPPPAPGMLRMPDSVTSLSVAAGLSFAAIRVVPAATVALASDPPSRVTVPLSLNVPATFKFPSSVIGAAAVILWAASILPLTRTLAPEFSELMITSSPAQAPRRCSSCQACPSCPPLG